MSLGLDEEKAKEAEHRRAVDANYRTLRIIWFAILASVIAIFVVTRVLRPMPSVLTFLFWILFAVGIANLFASFFLKHMLLKQAVTKRKPDLVRGAYLIAFALCESIGLLGLIAHVVTGVEQYYFLLCPEWLRASDTQAAARRRVVRFLGEYGLKPSAHPLR